MRIAEPVLEEPRAAGGDPGRPDEEIALKTLSALTLGDEKVRARFAREGRALAQLDHSCVLRVLDYGVADSIPYLAMEWVRGQNLADLLEEARAVPADLQTQEALRESHERALALQPNGREYLRELAVMFAGSNKAACAECAAWFEEHPGFEDIDRVEGLILRWVQLDRGRHAGVDSAVGIARRIGRTAKMEQLIEEVLAQDQRRISVKERNRLAKALEKLRR